MVKNLKKKKKKEQYYNIGILIHPLKICSNNRIEILEKDWRTVLRVSCMTKKKKKEKKKERKKKNTYCIHHA